MAPPTEEIREIIIQILKELLQEFGITGEPISEYTLLSGDLGLSSVDALQVMATLDQRLGTKLPYEKLINHMGEYPADITVARLAEFAHEHFDDLSQQGPIAE